MHEEEFEVLVYIYRVPRVVCLVITGLYLSRPLQPLLGSRTNKIHGLHIITDMYGKPGQSGGTDQ